MSVKELRSRLEQLKGQRKQVEFNIKRTGDRIAGSNKSLRSHEKAREVIQQVGLKTQGQLSYNISEIASMALTAVLENPYELKVVFVQRRNKTECDLFFVRDDAEIDPFDGGGGAVDVAGFALRVASWSMTTPQTRPVLLLDEPFKHLKGEGTNRKMLDMIKQVSDKLGIQIIMVSDERVSRDATVEATDLLFETTIKNGVTQINVER